MKTSRMTKDGRSSSQGSTRLVKTALSLMAESLPPHENTKAGREGPPSWSGSFARRVEAARSEVRVVLLETGVGFGLRLAHGLFDAGAAVVDALQRFADD